MGGGCRKSEQASVDFFVRDRSTTRTRYRELIAIPCRLRLRQHSTEVMEKLGRVGKEGSTQTGGSGRCGFKRAELTIFPTMVVGEPFARDLKRGSRAQLLALSGEALRFEEGRGLYVSSNRIRH